MATRLDRYEARAAKPLLGLGLAFIVVYGVPIVEPGLPVGLRRAFDAANLAIWLIFAVDLILRAKLSGRWFRYLLTNPVDVVVVALPALRPLRVLRVFTATQVLITKGGHLSLLRTSQAIATAASLLVLIGTLAVLDAERTAGGGSIATFGDPLWWSLVTVTTVGYGDMAPVTWVGRIVAAVLMLKNARDDADSPCSLNEQARRRHSGRRVGLWLRSQPRKMIGTEELITTERATGWLTRT